MKLRKTFPTSGIYAALGGIADTYYLNKADQKRYRYLMPSEYAQPCNSIADCWIVDAQGNINPGTNVSPVPFCREAIGRKIA